MKEISFMHLLQRTAVSTFCFVSFLCVSLGFSGAAQAVLEIRITQSSDLARPIAIVPFEWQGEQALPTDVSRVVRTDLERSGQFKALAEEDMLAKPSAGSRINWQNWRTLEMPHLLVGKIRSTGEGRYAVDVQLFDVNRGRQLLGYSYPATAKTLRRTAHKVADEVYEEITGVRGAFSTRIAFVSVETRSAKDRTFSLQVADADGHAPRTVVRSSQPILSPTWSPDGMHLAYVSFRNRQAEVFAVNLRTGKEQKLSGFDGINGAPAFSPDGNQLAMALSRSGNPDIYVLDMKTRQLKQITRGYSIETEPSWSSDGDTLYYTSGRTGSPQIYAVSARGGTPKRVSFESGYNASAAASPDGRNLAMVHSQRGSYRIAVKDLKSDLFRVLTDGPQDESPSFAPNGQMLLYATQKGGKGVLAAVSLDGRVKQELLLTEGDIREPAWSPFNNGQ